MPHEKPHEEPHEEPPGVELRVETTADVATATPGRLALPLRVAELVALAVIAGLAVWFLIGAQALNERAADAVGPGTFPMMAATLLLAAVAVAAAVALRSAPGDVLEVKRPAAVGLAMALLLAFAPLTEMFGYYIIIVPWALGFALAAKVRSPMMMGITLATVLFVAFVIFDLFLGTPIP